MIYVLYHATCYDGFGAAWAAWRVLKNEGRYLPVSYGHPPPGPELVPDGASVIIADFSYPRETLLAFRARLGELTVLDHHQTAQADLAGLDFARFDLEKSGARLSWEFWHPLDSAPPLIEYVEDRDLWRFRLGGSREVSAWLRSYPWDFAAWDECHERLVDSLDTVIFEGIAILRFQSQQVSMMADNAWWTVLGGHRVPVTNATVFFSEVGEELCRRHPDAPFAAYYLDRADGKRQWGLRSRGDFDCSAVAKQYGGGGHPGAAGWVEPLDGARGGRVIP